MEKEPLLSVIVPVYNTGRYLERCMDSLIKQSYKNLEIILIDDGSTDDSPSVCDMYAKKMNRVRVLHKENAGLGFARNSGLDMANGEYVAFLDSDDYVAEDMYSVLMTECIHSKTDAAFCDYSIVKNEGTHVEIHSNLGAGMYTGKQILMAMLGAAPESEKDFDMDMSVWKAVYSRKHIESAGLRFPSERKVICEDLMFNLQFLQKAENISYIKNCLYCYCENEGSLTHRYIPNRLEKEKYLYGLVRKLLENQLNDGEWIYYHRLFLGRIRSTIGQEVYYAKNNSFKKCICAIQAIAGDNMVRSVIENYPIGKNPIKLRIFNTFLKWKFCFGMYLLIKLKG